MLFRSRSRIAAHRRRLVREALERSGGNRSRAARDLGLSRQALLYLMKGLAVPSPRSRVAGPKGVPAPK